MTERPYNELQYVDLVWIQSNIYIFVYLFLIGEIECRLFNDIGELY